VLNSSKLQYPWQAARHAHVRVRDFDCHVITLGDPAKPPLLLVHGWPQTAQCWRQVAPLMAEDFYVVMPDLRGLGESRNAPLSAGQGCKEEMAKDLIALLDTMNINKVHAIGHDWGGWITAIATLRYPERFERYICLAVPHLWRKFDATLLRNLWRFWYQLVAAGPLAGPAINGEPGFVTQFTRMNVAHPERWSDADFAIHADAYRHPETVAATRRIYSDFLLREFVPVGMGRYQNVRAVIPTRYVLGREDKCISWELGGGIEAHGDDIALEIWEDVGHFIPEEEPLRLAEFSKQFFQVETLHG